MANAGAETMLPIVKTVMIKAPRDVVFEPSSHHLGLVAPRRFVRSNEGPLPAVTLEPREGGAIFEVTSSGNRLEWGTVTAIEKARSIRMQWHLGRPVETVVVVSFEECAPDETIVTLTHSGWEALEAAGATVERASYDRGWDMILGQAFANAFAQKGQGK